MDRVRQRARVARHAAGSLLAERLRRGRRRVDPVPPDTLDRLFDAHPADVAFVHVGLSDVDATLPGNPYRRVRDALLDHYGSVLAAGYTTSFRKTRRFHRQRTPPEYGTFARLFHADATYRTADPMYSILVHGDYRFDDATPSESFTEASPFGSLDRDDALYVNVGTDGFRCSHLHYLERRADVPYCRVVDLEGVVHHTDAERERVTHTCLVDDHYRRYNRPKLERVLSAAGVLHSYDCNGLRVRFCRARDVREVLEPRLDDDPYFLVT